MCNSNQDFDFVSLWRQKGETKMTSSYVIPLFHPRTQVLNRKPQTDEEWTELHARLTEIHGSASLATDLVNQVRSSNVNMNEPYMLKMNDLDLGLVESNPLLSFTFRFK